MKKGFTQTTNEVIAKMFWRSFLLSLIISMTTVNCKAQYTPFHYFTFDGIDPLKDSLSASTLNTAYYQSAYSISPSAVGKSLTLGAGGKDIIVSGTLALDTVVTIEFLFKPSHDFNTCTFITRRDNAVYIKMNYPLIEFVTYAQSSSGATIYNDQKISLEGVGRGSFGYYVDGNFHQMVFKYNAKTGVKEVWIDGQLPNGFATTTAPGRFNPNTSNIYNNILDLSSVSSSDRMNGDIDELALYNIDLPGNIIYKHYTEFQQGKHYSFNNTTLTVPTPSPITAGIDLNDYPVGHPTPSISAIDQLKNYPTPRYKKGHTLLPNFDWIGMEYFGSAYQPGVSTTQAVNNTVAIQTELAKNFNYSVLVASNTCSYTQYPSTSTFQGAWVQLANQNPQWKTSAISFWAQINPQVAGFSSNSGYISNKNLPDKHYLKNNSNQYLDLNGNTSNNKYWSPSAPVDSFYKDGLTQNYLLTKLLGSLTRPLDFLCENGEVIPKPEISCMQKDPSVVNDKNTTTYDWDTYLGNRKLKTSLAYREQFIHLPGLQNTKYTEYQISGATSRIKYSETRNINKPINGMMYATPDFYPRWASNWYNGVSAWNGWLHIAEGRYYEILQNDKLYSPFIAAGWDLNEENNIRPGQWLGLLKLLGMTGAEFYYTGYFNEAGSYNAPNPPPANPAGYAWQAVMPSYAQATTSRYEDILRNGSLITGDSSTYTTSSSGRPSYTFNTGDLRKMVVIRKSDTKEVYAITGTIQPNSNMMGNSEIEGDVLITLKGQQLKFKIRRQGSTFIYDNTNPANPLFYQLDGWHESSHPSRWSKDFNIEAELFDNTTPLAQIKTVRAPSTVAGDFRNSTSYVSRTTSATTNPTLEYNFTPRSTSNYYFWVRARNNGGVPSGISVSLNNQNPKSIGCISDTSWNWYSVDACSNSAINFSSLSPQEYTLMVTPNGSSIEIDRMFLTIDPSINLNSNQAVCGSSVANVTLSGPTNFCQGGNVTITASTGNSYVWSSGQTTQSITVSTAGNYSVAINNGTGCASVSNPVNVSVQAKPASTITPSGATTLCSGQNVNLSASVSSSYLWSNGATTQSINATTTSSYIVTVTNSSGCSAVSNAQSVTVNPSPSTNITANGNTSFCQGGSVVLSAPSGYSYVWSNGKTTQQITVNTSGSYVATVSSGSCSAISTTMIVTVNGLPAANISASGPLSFCTGGSVQLSATGGTNYVWSNGSTVTAINVNQSGSYSVIATNSNGCSATSNIQTVNVTSVPNAIITTNGNTSFCQGGSVVLSAPSGYNYVWTNGATTQQVTVNTSGSFGVTVSSSSTCSSTSTPIAVVVNALPTSNITSNGPLSFCAGGNVQLNATGGTSYLWSNGATSSSTIVSQSGNYSVIATNSNGCTAVTNVLNVQSNPLPTVTVSVSGPTTLTTGQTTTLSANGGTTYLWSPGGMTTSSINVTSAGTYSVIATNTNNCTAQSNNIIISPNTNTSSLSIQPAGPTTFCDGGSVSLNVIGGTNNYLWSPGGSMSNSINATKEGMYYVYSLDQNGQVVGRDSIEVKVNPNPITPEIRITYIPNTAFQLTAFEPSAVTYLWSNGQTTSSVNITSASSLSVKTTNAFGCPSNPQYMKVNSVLAQNCTMPDMLTAFNLSDTSANLGWNPGITAELFKVKYWETGSIISTEVTISGSLKSLVLPNLTPGTTYNWNVKSVCTSGVFQSSTSSFKTLSNPLSCGSVPEHLRAVNVKIKRADLVWYSTIADSYQVRYRPVGNTTWISIKLIGNNYATGTSLANLQSNKTYEWQVQTTCKGYTSPYSLTSLFTTLDYCGDLGTLTLLESYPSAISLKWTNTTPMNSVRIKLTEVLTGKIQVTNLNFNPSNGQYIVKNLKLDTKYLVEVRGICTTGIYGPWSNSITVTTSNINARVIDGNPLQLIGYPNPTNDRLFYTFNTSENSDYVVKVSDLSGRELLQEIRSAESGDNSGDVAVNNFAKGIYILIVQKGTATSRFRFAVE